MSADPISPGDWVEFIGSPQGYTSPPGVRHNYVVGSLYRVAETGRRCLDGAGVVWSSIRIVGMPTRSAAGRELSVPVAAFRPIRSDITSLEKLLTQPIPADLVEA